MSYYVYILTKRSRQPFYTGVTNSIERRTWEHKNDVNDGYTRKYRLHEVVYFEQYSVIQHAITREKQIKYMHRAQKIELVLSMNPQWKDLSAELFVRHRYEPEAPGETADVYGNGREGADGCCGDPQTPEILRFAKTGEPQDDNRLGVAHKTQRS